MRTIQKLFSIRTQKGTACRAAFQQRHRAGGYPSTALFPWEDSLASIQPELDEAAA